jgi:MoxR-like ATPase
MIEELNYKRYTGDQQEDFEEGAYTGRAIPPYFPSEELVKAVEYARVLQRPLLLRGEPGSGKTRLAQSIAYDLYGADYKLKYFEWHIKSTSKAVEGLYTFDHVERLRDAQLQKGRQAREYRELGPLGKAFSVSTSNAPAVVLIDEIDKADIDFPNDLLLELDQKRFTIKETKEEILAAYPPIIIITSNDEKELPNAFLRRCVFHYIKFPAYKQLLLIAKANAHVFQDKFGKPMPAPLIEATVTRFRQLYNNMNSDPNTDKNPSTSELLDWLRVIYFYFFNGQLSEEMLPDGELPHPQVLLKSIDDYKSQMNQE